jgi:hypothetical protein
VWLDATEGVVGGGSCFTLPLPRHAALTINTVSESDQVGKLGIISTKLTIRPIRESKLDRKKRRRTLRRFGI